MGICSAITGLGVSVSWAFASCSIYILLLGGSHAAVFWSEWMGRADRSASRRCVTGLHRAAGWVSGAILADVVLGMGVSHNLQLGGGWLSICMFFGVGAKVYMLLSAVAIITIYLQSRYHWVARILGIGYSLVWLATVWVVSPMLLGGAFSGSILWLGLAVWRSGTDSTTLTTCVVYGSTSGYSAGVVAGGWYLLCYSLGLVIGGTIYALCIICLGGPPSLGLALKTGAVTCICLGAVWLCWLGQYSTWYGVGKSHWASEPYGSSVAVGILAGATTSATVIFRYHAHCVASARTAWSAGVTPLPRGGSALVLIVGLLVMTGVWLN